MEKAILPWMAEKIKTGKNTKRSKIEKKIKKLQTRTP